MKAWILDTVTSKVYMKNGPRSWEWAENNWSCDCNRAEQFEDSPDECGCKRYLVDDWM